ncbi:mucin-2-like [Penaeus indicus]|uniref:mucin-2-like n=1 Tax=Penaeus indicus TaxID=29960 RepID=UPI00300C02E0
MKTYATLACVVISIFLFTGGSAGQQQVESVSQAAARQSVDVGAFGVLRDGVQSDVPSGGGGGGGASQLNKVSRQHHDCNNNDITECVGLLEALTNEDLGFAATVFELNEMCPVLLKGLLCIDNYTRRCLTHSHREYFNKLYAGTIRVIKDLCNSQGKYQQEYIRHAPCMRTVNSEYNLCSEIYHQKTADLNHISDAVATLDDEEKNRNVITLCCSFQEYLQCSERVVFDTCGNETASFTKEFLDRMAGPIVQDICQAFSFRASSCPEAPAARPGTHSARGSAGTRGGSAGAGGGSGADSRGSAAGEPQAAQRPRQADNSTQALAGDSEGQVQVLGADGGEGEPPPAPSPPRSHAHTPTTLDSAPRVHSRVSPSRSAGEGALQGRPQTEEGRDPLRQEDPPAPEARDAQQEGEGEAASPASSSTVQSSTSSRLAVPPARQRGGSRVGLHEISGQETRLLDLLSFMSGALGPRVRRRAHGSPSNRMKLDSQDGAPSRKLLHDLTLAPPFAAPPSPSPSPSQPSGHSDTPLRSVLPAASTNASDVDSALSASTLTSSPSAAFSTYPDFRPTTQAITLRDQTPEATSSSLQTRTPRAEPAGATNGGAAASATPPGSNASISARPPRIKIPIRFRGAFRRRFPGRGARRPDSEAGGGQQTRRRRPLRRRRPRPGQNTTNGGRRWPVRRPILRRPGTTDEAGSPGEEKGALDRNGSHPTLTNTRLGRRRRIKYNNSTGQIPGRRRRPVYRRPRIRRPGEARRPGGPRRPGGGRSRLPGQRESQGPRKPAGTVWSGTVLEEDTGQDQSTQKGLTPEQVTTETGHSTSVTSLKGVIDRTPGRTQIPDTTTVGISHTTTSTGITKISTPGTITSTRTTQTTQTTTNKGTTPQTEVVASEEITKVDTSFGMTTTSAGTAKTSTLGGTMQTTISGGTTQTATSEGTAGNTTSTETTTSGGTTIVLDGTTLTTEPERATETSPFERTTQTKISEEVTQTNTPKGTAPTHFSDRTTRPSTAGTTQSSTYAWPTKTTRFETTIQTEGSPETSTSSSTTQSSSKGTTQTTPSVGHTVPTGDYADYDYYYEEDGLEDYVPSQDNGKSSAKRPTSEEPHTSQPSGSDPIDDYYYDATKNDYEEYPDGYDYVDAVEEDLELPPEVFNWWLRHRILEEVAEAVIPAPTPVPYVVQLRRTHEAKTYTRRNFTPVVMDIFDSDIFFPAAKPDSYSDIEDTGYHLTKVEDGTGTGGGEGPSTEEERSSTAGPAGGTTVVYTPSHRGTTRYDVTTSSTSGGDGVTIGSTLKSDNITASTVSKADNITTSTVSTADDVTTSTTSKADDVTTNTTSKTDDATTSTTSKADDVITSTPSKADNVTTSTTSKTDDVTTSTTSKADDVTTITSKADDVTTSTSKADDVTLQLAPLQKQMTSQLAPLRKQMTSQLSHQKQMTSQLAHQKQMTSQLAHQKQMTSRLAHQKQMTSQLAPLQKQMTSQLAPLQK